MMNIIKKCKSFFLRLLPQALIVCSFFLFTDCKRTLENQEFFGPGVTPAPAGFTGGTLVVRKGYVPLSAPNPANVNFLQDSVIYTATFSHEVTWTLTITGPESGAEKIFSGMSNTIDTVWDGSSSNIYHFKRGEDAVAVVSFLGSSITLSDTIDVFRERTWIIANGITHHLFDNFEDPRMSAGLTGKYKNAGDTAVISGLSTDVKIQGNYSYRLAGTDVNNNSWVAGINTEFLDYWWTAPDNYPFTVTDPAQLYFNLYVYGTGKAGTTLQFKAYERDVDITPYDQFRNDGWIFPLTVTWTGWKLVSIPYSDFRKASDPYLGGNGNGFKEPHRISGMNIELDCVPIVGEPGQSVEAYIDYLIITENGPFLP